MEKYLTNVMTQSAHNVNFCVLILKLGMLGRVHSLIHMIPTQKRPKIFDAQIEDLCYSISSGKNKQRSTF